MLDKLRELYDNGKLMLNAKNIEKVQMYLQEIKVMKAAGIDPEEQRIAYLEKKAKLFKRKYMKKGPIQLNDSLDELNQGPPLDYEQQQRTLYQDQSILNVEFFDDIADQLDLNKDQGQIEEPARPIHFNDEQSEDQEQQQQVSESSVYDLQLQIQMLENQLKGLGDPTDEDSTLNSIKRGDINQESSLQPVNFNIGENFNDTGFKVSKEAATQQVAKSQTQAQDPKILELREQLRLLIEERDRKKAENDAVLIVKHKQEKNLQKVAAEREKKRKKMEQQMTEKGYKKLRKGVTKSNKFEIVTPSSPRKNIGYGDVDRIRVEDIEEESKDLEDSSSKLASQHIEEVEFQEQ